MESIPVCFVDMENQTVLEAEPSTTDRIHVMNILLS